MYAQRIIRIIDKRKYSAPITSQQVLVYTSATCLESSLHPFSHIFYLNWDTYFLDLKESNLNAKLSPYTFVEADFQEKEIDKPCFIRASEGDNSIVRENYGKVRIAYCSATVKFCSNSTENFQSDSIFCCLELKWAPNRHTKGQSWGKLDKIVNIRSLRNLSSSFLYFQNMPFNHGKGFLKGAKLICTVVTLIRSERSLETTTPGRNTW